MLNRGESGQCHIVDLGSDIYTVLSWPGIMEWSDSIILVISWSNLVLGETYVNSKDNVVKYEQTCFLILM